MLFVCLSIRMLFCCFFYRWVLHVAPQRPVMCRSNDQRFLFQPNDDGMQGCQLAANSLAVFPVGATCQSSFHHHPIQFRFCIPVTSLPCLVAPSTSSSTSLGRTHLPMPSHFGLAWRRSRSVCSIWGPESSRRGTWTSSSPCLPRGRNQGYHPHPSGRPQCASSRPARQPANRSDRQWAAFAPRGPTGGWHDLGIAAHQCRATTPAKRGIHRSGFGRCPKGQRKNLPGTPTRGQMQTRGCGTRSWRSLERGSGRVCPAVGPLSK